MAGSMLLHQLCFPRTVANAPDMPGPDAHHAGRQIQRVLTTMRRTTLNTLVRMLCCNVPTECFVSYMFSRLLRTEVQVTRERWRTLPHNTPALSPHTRELCLRSHPRRVTNEHRGATIRERSSACRRALLFPSIIHAMRPRKP